MLMFSFHLIAMQDWGWFERVYVESLNETTES